MPLRLKPNHILGCVITDFKDEGLQVQWRTESWCVYSQSKIHSGPCFNHAFIPESIQHNRHTRLGLSLLADIKAKPAFCTEAVYSWHCQSFPSTLWCDAMEIKSSGTCLRILPTTPSRDRIPWQALHTHKGRSETSGGSGILPHMCEVPEVTTDRHQLCSVIVSRGTRPQGTVLNLPSSKSLVKTKIIIIMMMMMMMIMINKIKTLV